MADNINELTGLPQNLLDAYKKNTGGEDITQYSALTPAEPGSSSSTSFQSYDWRNPESYTKRGITPLYGSDNEDIRAERQSIGDKWANGLIKAVGVAGTSALESTAGLVYGLGAAASGQGNLYDNDFARGLDNFNKQLQEAFPNYYTKKEQEYSFGRELFTANFWADKFLNGAGYAAGALVTGYGLSKFAALSKLAGAGKLVGLTEEAIAADKSLTSLAKTVKFLDNADFAKNAVLMSTGESAAEARQAKDETRQRLIDDFQNNNLRSPNAKELAEIENLAESAGNVNYAANLFITGISNAIQFKKMLGPGYNASKKTLNNITEKIGTSGVAEVDEFGLPVLEAQIKNVGKERLKAFGKGFIEEGGQEAAQFMSQKTVSDYYGRRFDKNNPNHSFIESMVEGMSETFGSKEGWENIMLGGLLGGPMGMIGVAGETAKSNENTKKVVNLINNNKILSKVKNSIENATQAASYQAEKDEYLKRGDIHGYKNAEFQERKTYIKQLIEAGGVDVLMDRLDAMKGMSVNEFKKAVGYEEDVKLNPGSTYGDTDADVSNHIEETKKKIVGLKNTYDKINIAFPLKSTDPTEIGVHKILTETLWDASTNIDNIDQREKELSQHIATLTKGESGLLSSVDQEALRKEFGDDWKKEYEKRFKESLEKITNPLIKDEAIAAKKDIDKLTKEREHYIDTYNKLAKGDYAKELVKEINEIKKTNEKKAKKHAAELNSYKEGDILDVEIMRKGYDKVPIKFKTKITKNNKGELYIYDSVYHNHIPLSTLLTFRDNNDAKFTKKTVEELKEELDIEIQKEQNRVRSNEIKAALKTLTTKLNNIKTIIADKQALIGLNQEEIARLRNVIKKAASGTITAEDYTDIQNSIDKLNAEIVKANKAIISLNKDAKELSEDIKRGEKALVDLPFRTRAFVKKELEGKKSALESIKKILKGLRDLVYGLSKTLNNLKETASFLLSDKVKNRKRYTDFKQDLKDREKQIDNLEKTIYANIDIKNKLQKDITRLEKELQLIDNIAAKMNAELEAFLAPPKGKDFQKKDKTDGDPEITSDNENPDSSKNKDKSSLRKGFKKPNLATTAGKNVITVGPDDYLESFLDDNGEVVLTDDEDQKRWFNYLRNPENRLNSGEYSLKVEVDNSEKGKKIAESTGQPVIKATLMKAGEEVKLDSKSVYTYLHLSNFALNTQVGEPLPGETTEQFEARLNAEIAAHDLFRNTIINSKKPLYVKVSGQSDGKIVFTKETQSNKRASHSLLGRVVDKISDLVGKIFISETLEGNSPFLSTSPDVTYVGQAGKVYLMVKTPSGRMMPVQLQTRELSKSELDLISKLLIIQMANKSNKARDNAYKILKELIYIPSFKNRGKNPSKDIYFDKGTLKYGINAEGNPNEMNIADFSNPEKLKELQNWLQTNKLHQVSKTLLNEKTKVYKKVLDVDGEGNAIKYELFDSYLDYLVGDYKKAKKDEQGQPVITKRSKSERVLGTDLAMKDRQFVNMYATFERNLLEEDPSKTATTASTASKSVVPPDAGPPSVDDILTGTSSNPDDFFPDPWEGMEGLEPIPVGVNFAEELAKGLADLANKPPVFGENSAENPTAVSDNNISDSPNPDALNDFARTAKQSPENFVPIDIDKEEAWFKNKFPQINFIKVKELIKLANSGIAVQGLFQKALVKIFEGAEEGTAYHEAFHVVSQLFLTPEERSKLYKEASKKYPKPTETDLKELKDINPHMSIKELIDAYYEEKLAEDFRVFVLSNAKSKPTVETKNIFIKLFNKLKEWVKNLLGINSYIDQIYNRIENGYYSDKVVLNRNLASLGNTKYASRALNGLTLEEERDLFDFLSHRILNVMINRGYSFAEINSQLKYRNSNDPQLMSIINAAYITLGPSGKLNNNNQTLFEAFGGRIGKYAVNNWDTVVKEHKKYLKKYNIKFSGLKESEDGIITEEQEVKKAFEDKESMKYSTKDGLPNTIRLLISSLADKKFVNGELKNNFSPSMLHKPVDFTKTYNWLLNNLIGLSRFEDMVAKLEENKTSQPFITELLQKFNAPSTEFGKIKLRTDFTQAFNKTKHNYITILLDPNTGNIYSVDSNANRLEEKVKNNWEAALRASNIIETKDGQLIINKQKAEEIKNLDDFSLLKSLGITFSKPEKINSKSPEFTKALLALRNFLQEQVIKKEVPITTLFRSANIKFEDSIANRLNDLVKIETENQDSITELQFINAEGETVYQITLNSTLSTIINDAKNGYPLIKDLYNNNSVYLEALNNGKLTITLLDGMRANIEGDEGQHSSKLTESDLISARFNALLNPNRSIQMLPTTGDKKQQWGIEGFNIVPSDQIIVEDDEYQFSEDIIDQFYGYFIDEFSRIKSDEGENIDIYKDKRNNFSIFDAILSDKLKEKLLKTSKLTPKLQKQVIEDITEYLAEKSRENLEFLNENLITKKVNNKYIGISNDIINHPNYVNKSLEELISIFTVTDLISKIEIIKLFTGDLAYFKDFPKRTPGLIATGKQALTGDEILNDFIERTMYPEGTLDSMKKRLPRKVDGTYNVFGLPDRKLKSIYYNQYVNAIATDIAKRKPNLSTEQILTEATDLASSYLKINEGDGQGYITIEAYREFLFRTSDWTENHEELYKRIMKGETLKFKELQMFQPLKPMSYGKKVRQDNLNASGYLKYSLFPLIPSVIKGSKLELLAGRMYQLNADQAVFESGVKSGYEPGISTFNYKFTKIQVDNNPHKIHDTKNIYGTQARILVSQNQRGLKTDGTYGDVHTIPYMLNDVPYTYSEIYNQYINANRELVNRSAEEITKRFLNADGTINGKELVADLKEQLAARDVPSNILDALGYDENTKDLIVPLDLLVNREKVANVLNAMITNGVIRQKMPGDLKVQVAPTGFERSDVQLLTFDEINEQYGGDITAQIEGFGTGRLKGLHIDPNNPNKIQPMQILLPAWYKGLIDIGQLDEQGRTIIGYRIPTTGINSLEHIEVAGFLPPEAGNTVVIATETVTKSGTDYDFDKLNLFLPNLVFNSETNSWETVKYNDSLSIKENSEAQIQNRLIQLMTSILSHPENFAQMINPVGPDLMKKDSVLIKKLQGITEDDNISPTKQIEFKNNIKTTLRFIGSKTGVGQMAGHITHHVQSQMANLYVADPNVILYFNHNKYNNKPSLAGITDSNGNYISDSLNAIAQSYVDAAKDPFIMDLNGNTFTCDTSAFMIRVGGDYKFVNRFMVQPILSDYIKLVNLSESKIVENQKDLYQPNNSRIKEVRKKYLTLLSAEDQETYKEAAYLLDQTANLDAADTLRKTFKMLDAPTLETTLGVPLEQMNTEQIKMQLQVLDNFLSYQQAGIKLREAMKASSDTTVGAGKNLNESQQIQDQKEKVINDGFLGNYNKLYTDTFLNAFDQGGAKLALKLQKDLWINQKQSIKDAIRTLNKLVGKEFNQKIEILDKISNHMLGFLMNKLGTSKLSSADINTLLKDKRDAGGRIVSKSVARYIAEIQADSTHPLHKSYLFDPANGLLGAILNKDINGINNIKIINTKVDSITSELVTEAFRELYLINPQLVNDILAVGWLQSGLNNSILNFIKFIPQEIYIDKFKSAINEFLKNPKLDISEFVENFLAHNSTNSDLVPKLYTSKERVTKIGEDGDYIILSDSFKNGKIRNYNYINFQHLIYYDYQNNESTYRPQFMKYIGTSNIYDNKRVYMRIAPKGDGFRLMNENNTDNKTIIEKNKFTSIGYEAIAKEIGLIADNSITGFNEEEPRFIPVTPEIKPTEFKLTTQPSTQGATNRKTYSGKVTSLQPNQIFVFGSNEGSSKGGAPTHGAGSAKIARDKFGAIQGQSRGIQGQSYAIVTKKFYDVEKSSTPQEIIKEIKGLYEYAKQNPSKEFLVSDYSESNLNGYTGQEMADMFTAAGPIPSNIVFNENFNKLIQPSTQTSKIKPTETQPVITQTPKKSSNNLVISELKRNFEGYRESLSKLGINTIEDFDKLSLQEEEELVKKLCNP